jgi:hypothetical protein
LAKQTTILRPDKTTGHHVHLDPTETPVAELGANGPFFLGAMAATHIRMVEEEEELLLAAAAAHASASLPLDPA